MFNYFVSLHPEAQAVWAQAVLSLVAIGVAIWVPWHQRRWEQQDRRRKDEDVSRDLALELLPAVQYWQQSFSMYRHPESPLAWAMEEECWTLPKEIAESISQLHLLGPAARHLQTAVFLARELEVGNLEVRPHLRGDVKVVDEDDEFLAPWRERLDRLRFSLECAEREMKALFEKGIEDVKEDITRLVQRGRPSRTH